MFELSLDQMEMPHQLSKAPPLIGLRLMYLMTVVMTDEATFVIFYKAAMKPVGRQAPFVLNEIRENNDDTASGKDK